VKGENKPSYAPVSRGGEGGRRKDELVVGIRRGKGEMDRGAQFHARGKREGGKRKSKEAVGLALSSRRRIPEKKGKEGVYFTSDTPFNIRLRIGGGEKKKRDTYRQATVSTWRW